MRKPWEFTVRSGMKTLPASSGPTEPVDILRTEAQGAAWRLIEFCSASRLPFDAYLSWSSGSGAISMAQITVATGTRVCVYARTLAVQGENHSSGSANKVCATVADAFATTFNQYEHRFPSVTSKQMSIPPFAETVRVELADNTLLSGLTIDLLDTSGVRHSRTAGDAQPDSGIPIGGARTIELSSGTPVDLRAVFTLTL